MDQKWFCRCCLADKGISNDYYINSNYEVYTKMLTDTFNLNIRINKNMSNRICEDCILKLRDATTFKKQIIETEKALLKMLQENTQDCIEPVKQECEESEDEYEFDDSIDDDWVSDDDDSNVKNDKGQIFVIKLEPKDETVIKELKTTNKLPSRNLTAKNMNVNELLKKNINKENGIKKNLNKGVSKSFESKSPMLSKENAITPKNQLVPRENSLKLILNSNMCLFKSLKTKFGCFHCKSSFMTIKELREHAKTHSDTKNLKIRFNLLKGLSYKSVDITNLTCNLCSESCSSLNDLKSHLEAKHEFNFKNGEHFLVPYKLETDFSCVLCNQNFMTFTRLAIHMNSHYRNNVCEICGVSYINRLSLRMHVSSVHKEKKCSHCPQMFSSHYLKVKHMRKSHNVGISKRYCMLCNKTFRYSYLLMDHKIQEHGAKRVLSNCPECNKTFLSPQNMKIHIRAVHVKERNHACDFCGMRFFTKSDLRRHDRTHEDVRSFSCSFCEGRFKSKDSWKRHLKRQHGHTV